MNSTLNTTLTEPLFSELTIEWIHRWGFPDSPGLRIHQDAPGLRIHQDAPGLKVHQVWGFFQMLQVWGFIRMLQVWGFSRSEDSPGLKIHQDSPKVAWTGAHQDSPGDARQFGKLQFSEFRTWPPWKMSLPLNATLTEFDLEWIHYWVNSPPEQSIGFTRSEGSPGFIRRRQGSPGLRVHQDSSGDATTCRQIAFPSFHTWPPWKMSLPLSATLTEFDFRWIQLLSGFTV